MAGSSYRYWGVRSITSGSSVYSYNRIQLLDGAGTNLATDPSKASATNVLGSFAPGNAITGAGGQACYVSSQSGSVWLYDFGSPVEIDTAAITARDSGDQAQTPTIIDLVGSNDGTAIAFTKGITTPNWNAGETRTFTVQVAAADNRADNRFDPVTLGAGLNISLDGLTITGAAIGGDQGARGSLKTTGKRYFEMTVTAGGGDTGPGIASPSASYQGLGDSGAGGAIVFASGNTYCNGFKLNAGSYQGQTTQVAVDLDAKLVWFRNAGGWNGSASADPAAGLGGLDISAVSAAGVAPVMVFSTNTGGGTAAFQPPFARAVPNGFGPWGINSGPPPPPPVPPGPGQHYCWRIRILDLQSNIYFDDVFMAAAVGGPNLIAEPNRVSSSVVSNNSFLARNSVPGQPGFTILSPPNSQADTFWQVDFGDQNPVNIVQFGLSGIGFALNLAPRRMVLQHAETVAGPWVDAFVGNADPWTTDGQAQRFVFTPPVVLSAAHTFLNIIGGSSASPASASLIALDLVGGSSTAPGSVSLVALDVAGGSSTAPVSVSLVALDVVGRLARTAQTGRWSDKWKAPGVVLTDDRHTFTANAPGNSYNAVLGDGLLFGKVYVEFRDLGAAAGFVGIGFCRENQSLTNGVPGQSDTDAVAFYSRGAGIKGQNYTGSNPPAYYAGDVAGAALDTATGQVWFSKNGVWINGDPAAGTDGTVLKSDTFMLLGWAYFQQSAGSLNAGQRPPDYPIPAGFQMPNVNSFVPSALPQVFLMA